jgi:hypothetical protein
MLELQAVGTVASAVRQSIHSTKSHPNGRSDLSPNLDLLITLEELQIF